MRLLDELGYVGVLAVELFDVGGRLLANEFAPRVHNTGHWTIDGAVDEPVREPPARDPRAAARIDGARGSSRHGEPRRRRCLRSSACWRSPERTSTCTARRRARDASSATSRSSTPGTTPSPRSSAWRRTPGAEPLGRCLVLRGLAPTGVGVSLEVDVAAASVGDVRVALRRPEVGVAEHLLHRAEIGAAFEQVGGERVAEEMGVDATGLEPGPLGEARAG